MDLINIISEDPTFQMLPPKSQMKFLSLQNKRYGGISLRALANLNSAKKSTRDNYAKRQMDIQWQRKLTTMSSDMFEDGRLLFIKNDKEDEFEDYFI